MSRQKLEDELALHFGEPTYSEDARVPVLLRRIARLLRAASDDGQVVNDGPMACKVHHQSERVNS